MADSGSQFTIISEQVWQERFSAILLKETSLRPIQYGGKSITILGEFDAEFRFSSNCISTTVYVGKDESCLLGWVDQGRLEVILDPNGDHQVISKK